MGDITYPRVDGVVFIHGAFARGDRLFLPCKTAGKILEYRGWTFRRIEYVKRPRSEAQALRVKFDSSVRKVFVKKLATEHRGALESVGITKQQIIVMQKLGKVPSGYAVHHILPLDDGGTNDHSNLLFIRNDRTHSAITSFQNAFGKPLADGQSCTVDFPVPAPWVPVYPPAEMRVPSYLPLWRRAR